MRRIDRRWLGWVLVVVAPLIVAVAVVADGFARQGYVYARAFAFPLLAVPLAVGLLALSAHLLIRRRNLRLFLVWFSVVAALLGGCLGLQASAFLTTFDPGDRTILADTPRFRLVSYRAEGLFAGSETVLRVQSRNGLMSREGLIDIACFSDPYRTDGNEWIFGSATFSGETEIEAVAEDGTTWRISFDAVSLAAPQPLDRCTDAPAFAD
ncbi:hypothetical protein AB0M47_32005 [Hamadaea sp. NPDC051192]|uniref:hypothetical protein n=1 Tax=Hamadaea sp. NPDC051192 TaxID=3154940 RepID=UPI00342D15AA